MGNPSADRLTIRTDLHGDRHFEKVRTELYQTRDGHTTTLGIWRGTCVICSAPYTVAAPLDPMTILNGCKSFDVVTCPAHRLTPRETAALRYSRRDNRRQTFERIKAAKEPIRYLNRSASKTLSH
jgi:hypothetical protein